MLCVVYGLNYLDKTTLSYASVMGLQTDIGLKGDNYQWLGSMFYIGYIFWEYPTNCLLQRLPLAKWSAFNIIMWGLTLCCLAAVKNFAVAVAVRFSLVCSKRPLHLALRCLLHNGTHGKSKEQELEYGSASMVSRRYLGAFSRMEFQLESRNMGLPSSHGRLCS